MKPRRLLPFTAAITCALSASASAADVIKANNTDALNLGTSWSGGTAPTSTGVAVWNSTVTGFNTSALGGDASWQGIRIANVGGLVNQSSTTAGVQITNTSSANTLTLGSAGIDMSAATQALLIQSKLTLSASQTWNIADANTSGAPFAGSGINAGLGEDLLFNSQGANTAVNLGGFTLTTTGAGAIGFTSGHSFSNGTINLGNANTWIQSGGSRTVTLASDVTLNVAANSLLRLRANSGSGGIGINSAAAINVTGTNSKLQLEVNNGGNNLNQSGKVTLGNGATFENIFSNFSPINLSGEIASSGNITWLVNGAGATGPSTSGIFVSGNLTGNGIIAYQNTSTAGANGKVFLSGNNSGFTGTFNLSGSSGNRNLRLTTATAGSSSATWSVASGNTLEVDGVAVNLGTLNGAGTVTNSHATNAATLSIGSGIFSGAITNGSGSGGTALTKTGSGTLSLTGSNTYTGATNVNGGTLATTTAQTGGGAISVGDTGTLAVTQNSAAATFNSSNLTLGSAGGSSLTLTPAASPTAALITAPTFNVNGATTLRVAGTNLGATTLVDYTGTIGGTSGFAGLTLALPFRISATLTNDLVNTAVKMSNVQVDTPKWTGAVDSVWDKTGDATGASGSTANWQTSASLSSTRYVEAGAGQVDSVIFDDSATGSTAVTLNTTVTPVSVSATNSSQNYSISGSGSINGTGSLAKSGSGALTLATSNGYSGGTTLSAGTLNVNANTALGTGALTITGGTLDNTSGSAKVATNTQNWNGDFGFTGTNDLSLGTATLNATRQVTVNGGMLTAAGVTGGFGLTKAGAGTLAIGASSYTGATTVNGGTLRATSTTSFTGTSSITLANTAGVTLDLNGNSQTINNLTGGGTTGGNVVLGGATLTTGTGTDTTIGGLSGAGGLVKTGNGRLSILGNKSGYTGTTSISGGTLDIGTLSGAFGTGNIVGSNTVFVQGNGNLTNGITGGSSGFGARGGNLTLNVGGSGAIIALTSSGANGLGGAIFGSTTSDSRVIVQNGIDLNLGNNASRDITVNPGTGTASAEISGVISVGTIANIVKKGTGDLILSGANTYSGETAISAGRIVLGNNLALQNSPINTDNVGKIDSTGFTTPTFGGLKGSANLSTLITGGYSGITSLTLNTVNTNAALTSAGKSLTSFDGVITDGATGMNLVKSGAGTQTLNGVNTYTGATTISGGTLALGASGSIDNTSGVSLGSGGTFNVSAKSGGYTVNNLTGSGAVIGGISVTNQLAIGNSPGTTNFTGNLTLGASSTYLYEMVGGTSNADLGNVSGTLTITSGAVLDLVELGTFTVGDKFTLFGYTTGISGTFAGLADDSEFLDDLANTWRIDYNDSSAGLNGGTGSSFVTITAVPEPTAALLGGLGFLALLRRRRNL